jgi:rhodanese-related sulfurtransferase
VGLFSRTEQTDPASVAERLVSRSVLVVDVRQPSEWRHGHIRGSENEPLMQLKRRLDALPRDKTIVTVCASGHRSAVAARTLRRAGYTVENLKGGMHAWARAGLAIDRGTKTGR